SLLCCAAIAFVAEPQRALREEKYYRTLANVIKDLWNVVRSRRGFLGLLICFLPIGTGAASNLWSALEAIGLGAAATKYNLFASLSNIPIGYMTAVDGWAAARWGPGGMLHTEAAIGLAALLVFTAVAVASTRPREQVT